MSWLRRIWDFLRLLGRTHPYALRRAWPSWWACYKAHVVGPREAWEIAGVLMRADRAGREHNESPAKENP